MLAKLGRKFLFFTRAGASPPQQSITIFGGARPGDWGNLAMAPTPGNSGTRLIVSQTLYVCFNCSTRNLDGQLILSPIAGLIRSQPVDEAATWVACVRVYNWQQLWFESRSRFICQFPHVDCALD
ncbi:hypothetical protein M758_2G031600 [Ceratodon purpureus]|nr:hypothetical protein M758_2G031600 [Ceratodon purpureus]